MLAGLFGSIEPPRTSGSWPDEKMNSCEILLRRVPSVWAVAAEAIDIEQPSSDRATTALRIRESWCAWDDSIARMRRADTPVFARAPLAPCSTALAPTHTENDYGLSRTLSSSWLRRGLKSEWIRI